MQLRWIIIVFCLLQSTVLPAQDRLRYRHLTISDGLSSNNIHVTVQDKYGFIWIGTEEGLNRYDGYGFRVFRYDESDNHSLSNDNITDLLLDHSGTLWVATSSGLCRFNANTEKFDRFFDEEGSEQIMHSQQLIYKLLEDEHNRIFVATDNGIAVINENRTSFDVLFSMNDTLNDFLGNGINNLYLHNGNLLICAAGGQGMYQCSISDENLHVEPVSGPYMRQLSCSGFLSMDDNTVMVTSDGGLFLVNLKSHQTFPIYSKDPRLKGTPLGANSILRLSNGNILIGLFNTNELVNGLAFYNYADSTVFVDPFRPDDLMGLSWGHCTAVMESKDHLVWVSTSRGINIMDPTKQAIKLCTQFPELHFNQHDNIYAISRIGDQLILGNDGGGTYLYDLKSKAYERLHVPDENIIKIVYGILPISKSEFLAGTQTRGVYKVNIEKNTCKLLINAENLGGASQFNAGAIVKENDSIVWIGWMGAGLTRMNINTGAYKHFKHLDNDPSSISSNQVSSIFYDGQRYIWFGTSDGINTFSSDLGTGVDRMDVRTGEIKHYKHKINDFHSLSNNNVTDIKGDKHGNIWIATKVGLNKYDPNTDTFTSWRQSDGLPFEYLAAVEVDNDDNIWMSSWVNGIAMLNTQTNVIRSFGLNDGLQNLRFNRGSAYKDDDGNLYFGGISGFNIITPKNMSTGIINAPVYITAIKVNGSHLPDSIPVFDRKHIILDYHQSELQIDFIAPAYSDRENIAYYYRLAGYSNEWKLAGERAAYYTNLDPGNYTFEVKAVNKLNGKAFATTSLIIDIESPFWMTLWFKLLMVALLAGLVIVIVRIRTFALQRQKSALERTVAQRTHELAIAKDKAEQSEHFKQQFLANMSHEIRTPMNAVSGMTELLLENEHLPSQERYLTAIQKSSETLIHIINDILDISKVESGKMELENIHFLIKDVVDQVIQTLQIRADEKSLQLIAQVSSRTPEVIIGDPHRLKQILINLCGNAIKFTDKGSVLLKVEPVDKGIQFKVIDTGIGIPEDKINLVFESFRQAQSSDTRKYGGTGLGLSISKQLIELQGGSIHVESEVNSGTTFTCVIPFQKGDIAQLKSQSRSSELDVKALNGLKVLIVDDNEYNRILAKDTLQSKCDLIVVLAENGKMAIEKLQREDFDVILMDVQMPEMNGFEATEFIRQSFESPKSKIPIIALTASVLKTDLDKCRTAGMNSYVPKPFKAIQLFSTIAEVTGRNINTEMLLQTEKKTAHQLNVTDLAFLREFTEDDADALKRYINIYIEKTIQHISRLQKAIEDEDFEEIKTIVHVMKGHFKMMGMQDTLRLAAQIELMIEEGALEAGLRDINTLIVQSNASIAELQMQ